MDLYPVILSFLSTTIEIVHILLDSCFLSRIDRTALTIQEKSVSYKLLPFSLQCFLFLRQDVQCH